MTARQLTALAVRRVVAPGQRWRHRKTKETVVVYQPHRAERRIEAYPEGSDPRVPRTRFYVSFRELGRRYELLEGETERAA